MNATDFMAARSFRTHNEFIEPYLKPGMNVLDFGCGPRYHFDWFGGGVSSFWKIPSYQLNPNLKRAHF